MNKFTRIATLIAFSSATVAPVMAASGDLGTTSSAEVTIEASIANLVRISRLDNIDLGEFDGTNDLEAAENFCVYRNGAANYQLTASTSEGAFELVSGDDRLGYSVFIKDSAAAGTGSELTYNTALTGLDNADTSSLSCSDSDNTTVTVSIANEALAAVPAGSYAGTLTLTVAPE